MLRKSIVLFIAIVTLLGSGGCGKSIHRTYVRENVDMGFVDRIAVLPLENNSNEKFISERVRNAIATQLLSRKLFDVVDKGLVDNALQEEALEAGKPVDLNTLKRLGQRLNVQAFIVGSVDDAETSRKGSYSYPVMSLTLRMIETNAGAVLWQSNSYRSADSFWGRFFGFDSGDSFYNTDKLVKGIVRSIPKR